MLFSLPQAELTAWCSFGVEWGKARRVGRMNTFWKILPHLFEKLLIWWETRLFPFLLQGKYCTNLGVAVNNEPEKWAWSSFNLFYHRKFISNNSHHTSPLHARASERSFATKINSSMMSSQEGRDDFTWIWIKPRRHALDWTFSLFSGSLWEGEDFVRVFSTSARIKKFCVFN